MLGGILLHQTRRSSTWSDCIGRFRLLQTLCTVSSNKVYDSEAEETVDILVRWLSIMTIMTRKQQLCLALSALLVTGGSFSSADLVLSIMFIDANYVDLVKPSCIWYIRLA